MKPSDNEPRSTPPLQAKVTEPPGLVWEAKQVKLRVPTPVLLALVGLLLALVRAFT